jgi:RNA polymerase sigma factor (sigma-70 family)
MVTGQLGGVIQHLRRVLRQGARLTDGQLLRDYIIRRDEAAFAALVQRHGPMVWGVCRRVLGNHHDAEDAFQATFLVLVRRAASIASPELIANWLYGVAHQTAIKARATVAKRKVRERQVADVPEPAVVEHDLWNDLQPLLDQELSRLPDVYRVVIVLCDLEGKTRKEAAQQLGCPEGTMAGRLARARTMLAKRLSRRGVALSGGALAAVLVQQAVSAGMPNSVVHSTIKAASLLGAGNAAATGAISVKVAALMEGVMKAMLFTKLKAVVAVVLVLGFIGTGATVFSYRTAAAQSDTPAPLVEKERVKTPQKAEKETSAVTGKELDDLQGEWRMVAAEWDGEEIPTDYLKGRKWVVKGNEITVDALVFEEGRRKPGTSIDKLRFRLNPGKTPKEIDLTPLAGISKGTTTPGIYVIEGRRLRVCFVWVGEKSRPKEFATVAGLAMITLEKEEVKEKEKPAEKQAEKPDKEKDPFIAWGKVVDGLQAGLGFPPGQKRVYHTGEAVRLVVRVRNVGKEAVKFEYLRQFFVENPPAVTDGQGKPVRLASVTAFGFHVRGEVKLAPGQEIELYQLKLELRPVSESSKDRFSTLYGTGKFQIQYERVFGNSSSGQIKLDPNLEKLATGKLELEVKADPPPASEKKERPADKDTAAPTDDRDTKVVLEKAGKTANEIPDDAQKAFALMHVAIAQAKTGDRVRAAKTFEQSVRAAEAIQHQDDYSKGETLMIIATAQAEAGEVEAALKTAQGIQTQGTNCKEWALAHIASSQAKGRDIKGALQTVNTIPASGQAFALMLISARQVEAEDLKGAVKTAEQIQDGSYKVEALTSIARAQAKAADQAGARKSLQLALETAKALEDGNADLDTSRKAHALVMIAKAQVETGDLKSALHIAESLKGSFTQDRVLAHVAKAHVKRGKTPDALRIAGKLRDGVQKSGVLREVAKVQIADGDFKAARKTIDAIALVLDWESIEPLLEMAKAHVKAGDQVAAKAAFQEAIGKVQAPATLWHENGAMSASPSTLHKIMTARAEAGDEKGALAWADKQESPFLKSLVLAGVAEGLANRKQVQKGKNVPPRIETDNKKPVPSRIESEDKKPVRFRVETEKKDVDQPQKGDTKDTDPQQAESPSPPPVFMVVARADNVKGEIVFLERVYKIVNGQTVAEEYKTEFTIADCRVITPNGKQLRNDDLWKRLKNGAVVVVSTDGKTPAQPFLRALNAETLVIIPAPPKIVPPGQEKGR